MVTYGLLGLNLLFIVQLLVLTFSAHKPLSTQFRNAKIAAPILAIIAIASMRGTPHGSIFTILAILIIDLLIVELIDRLRMNWNMVKTCPRSLIDNIDARLEGR